MPSTFQVMTMSDIELEALKYNCEVIVGREDQLQFDLDTDEASEKFDWFHSAKIVPNWPDATTEEWNSKNNNRHVVITLGQFLSVEERIAMQAMGGSDPGREFAALLCHQEGSPHPILLFKPLQKLLGE